jgi:hypothetical protein
MLDLRRPCIDAVSDVMTAANICTVLCHRGALVGKSTQYYSLPALLPGADIELDGHWHSTLFIDFSISYFLHSDAVDDSDSQ